MIEQPTHHPSVCTHTLYQKANNILVGIKKLLDTLKVGTTDERGRGLTVLRGQGRKQIPGVITLIQSNGA